MPIKKLRYFRFLLLISFSSANETERLEKSKAAFFALRKNDNDQTSKGKEEWYDHFEAKLRALELRVGLEEGEDGTQSARLNRASSQPSVVQGMPLSIFSLKIIN